MIHALKQLPQYFEDVLSGVKSFEVRLADRPYRKGDLLALNEFDNETQSYTGRSCLVYVDYILSEPEYVKNGYVVMAIKPCGVCRYNAPFNIAKIGADYSVPLASKEYENERSRS